MPTDRCFWGPRDEQTALDLESATFQFTNVIDVMELVTAAENIEIKHDLLALTVEVTSASPANNNVIVVVEWAHNSAGPFFRPVPNPEISLEPGLADNVVSVETPGGIRFARFGLRVALDPGEGEHTINSRSSGEYIL